MKMPLKGNRHTRLSLAEKVAKTWNRASIPYAVVRGLENFPDKIGRDIDLVMGKSDVSDAVTLAVKAGLEHGFSRGFFRWSHWGLYQLVLVRDDYQTSLPIDFLCTTRVWNPKGISVLNKEMLSRFIFSDSRQGCFPLSREGAFYKSCVRPLLCGDLRRFGGEISLPVEIPATVNQENLKDILGAFGLALLKTNNLKALQTAYPKATRKLQWQWVSRHPLKAFVTLLEALRKRVMLNLANSSNVILIRTSEPEVINDCLGGLVQPLKNIFIELRPITTKYSSFRMIRGSLFGWRQRPISEFIIYTVVEIIPPSDSRNTPSVIQARQGRGRIGLGPDVIITIPAGMKIQTLMAQMKEQFLVFMEELYPLPGKALGKGEGAKKK